MKRSVLQMQAHAWGGPWEAAAGRQYDILEEALPVKTGCRIAENDTVARYKAVKL